jgi:sodium-dependent phosphate cotransporter
LAVFFSISALCAVLYLIVQSLSILVKGHAAKYLRKAVSLNGYLSMAMGVFITIMVQSSSITTSVLTPLAAVGLISLDAMYPLTLGANIGTTITGIMAATVVTSNPVQAWQVALSHLMFNIIGIMIFYPIPYMRKFPLGGARKLGIYAEKYGVWFPFSYIVIVFFVVPGIAYGIMVAAN